jgi:hypothetical protein
MGSAIGQTTLTGASFFSSPTLQIVLGLIQLLMQWVPVTWFSGSNATEK